MKHAMICLGAFLAVTFVGGRPAGAQETYVLDDDASYVEGCFPPCLCPLLFAPIEGTFTLRPVPSSDAASPTFYVEDIDWSVGFGGAGSSITGRGRYTIDHTGTTPRHRMVLKLRINGGQAVRFDSGLVPGGADFPHIDISIDRNNLQCYDTVIRVSASRVGEICGTIAGIVCEDKNDFCKFPEGTCDIMDNQGVCTPVPEACPAVYDPVCGCDGVTYVNECEADRSRVSIDHAGPCGSGAICGTIVGIPCEDPGEFCKFPDGTCNVADNEGVCTPIPFFCPLNYDPVCGCDGVTYTNECFSDHAQVSIDHDGPCDGGITACFTNADCVSLGPNLPGLGEYCKKPAGDCDGPGECATAPQYCLDVYDPVCGCDGNTYSNDCYAARAGVNVAYDGPCVK